MPIHILMCQVSGEQSRGLLLASCGGAKYITIMHISSLSNWSSKVDNVKNNYLGDNVFLEICQMYVNPDLSRDALFHYWQWNMAVDTQQWHMVTCSMLIGFQIFKETGLCI